MKRLVSSSSSDSLGGFMSICPNATEEEGNNNPMYVKELQSMMEGMEEEETGHVSEKKRRLSVEQVKALEKNFEVENKLEPERKVQLAQDLGLQPRQVAVWFQNRRARWKTKQLERDYGGLKSTYDALKLDFDRLHHDNESLLKQIRELKSKLDGGGDVEEKTEIDAGAGAAAGKSVDGGRKEEIWPKFGDLKDGCSDSDSSAILNEENNNNNNNNNNIGLMVKIEEHNFFGEESCSNLFSDDQAPSLQWYCNDQWN